MSDSLQHHGLQPTRLLCPWDFPGRSTGVGCHFLLQVIFPTQGSNLGLPHCRQTCLPSEPPGKSIFHGNRIYMYMCIHIHIYISLCCFMRDFLQFLYYVQSTSNLSYGPIYFISGISVWFFFQIKLLLLDFRMFCFLYLLEYIKHTHF